MLKFIEKNKCWKYINTNTENTIPTFTTEMMSWNIKEYYVTCYYEENHIVKNFWNILMLRVLLQLILKKVDLKVSNITDNL